MIFNIERYIGTGIEMIVECYPCLHFITVGMEILIKAWDRRLIMIYSLLTIHEFL